MDVIQAQQVSSIKNQEVSSFIGRFSQSIIDNNHSSHVKLGCILNTNMLTAMTFFGFSTPFYCGRRFQ